MPRLPDDRVPSYRLHKQSGRAVVTLSGRDFMLGRHGSAGSKAEYNRLIAEWLANGRQVHGPPVAAGGLTMNELVLAYWRHAKQYYRKDGRPTREVSLIRYALKPVEDLYGTARAKDFGPLCLRAVRERMIQLGWSRKNINNQVGRVKAMVKWGVSHELLPPSLHHALSTVEGLKKGRTAARETTPIKPAPAGDVDRVIATLSPSLAELTGVVERWMSAAATGGPAAAHLRVEAERLAARVPGESPVAAMIQVQRLTGMRSGELVLMRGCDVDVRGPTWIYRPASHKTEHHDLTRTVRIGPRAQMILRPFLTTDLTAYLFSPRAAAEARWKCMRQLRETKVQPSQVDRSKPNPRAKPGPRYDTASYRRAVDYACHKASVCKWHPHRLRHSFATLVRKELGIEAARAALGHTSSAVTEIYAEMDEGLASQVASRMG